MAVEQIDRTSAYQISDGFSASYAQVGRQLTANAPSRGYAPMSLDPAVRDAMLAAIPRLRAFANSLCRDGDQADDLVQETLLRACASISSFRLGSNMMAWLCTILRNHFYSEWRRRRRTFESIDDHLETLTEEPAQMARAEYLEVRAALAKLRAEEREAVILIAASGFSYAEAANICGCAEGTVKSRVHRARARLAELLSFETADGFVAYPMNGAAPLGADRAMVDA